MQMIGTSLGTSTSGNTKAEVPRKARNYLVTSYERDGFQLKMPEKPQISYLVECEDSTEDGLWHMHAFIYFTNPVAMASVKKIFGKTCHVERPQYNSLAIEYVKGLRPGEGKTMDDIRKHNILEFGEAPMDNGVNRTVADLKNLDDPSELEWRQYNTWERIHKRPQKMSTKEWYKGQPTVIYFYASTSGSGKTKAIVDWLETHHIEEFDEIKHIGDFWHGVTDGEGVAVYDDFRPAHMHPSEFINLIDYHVHNLNVKGGSVKNKYHTILISSIVDPHYMYISQSAEAREQWLRRMQIINVDPDN